MRSPQPRAWGDAWLGAGLCGLLWVSSPTAASADEPLSLSMVNRAPTHGDTGGPPSLIAGAVLSISGAVISAAAMVIMYGDGDGICVYDCEEEDDPHPALIGIAVGGAALAVVGALVVLPIQARRRRQWLRRRGLRFSGLPGGGMLGFEGHF